MIRLSQSSAKSYLTCPHQFWYSYILKLQLNMFNDKFFIGNMIHEGMHLSFIKDKDLFEMLGLYYDYSVEKEYEKYLISDEISNKFPEWKVIVLGMIYAYNIKNGKLIDDHEHIHNEKEYIIDLGDDVYFVIKLDNILRRRSDGANVIHEIKTSRELNSSYVNEIAYQVQIASYYWLGKRIAEFNPKGIVYDVLQKPSIRLKKNESHEDYILRLEEYYQVEPDKHLWTEILPEPGISEKELLRSLKYVAAGIRRGDFHKTWVGCGICDYKKPCRNDDAQEYLMPYTKKEEKQGGTIITDGEIKA